MKNTTLTDKHDILMQYFHEIPKVAPAAVALVLYFIAGCVVVYLTWRTRPWGRFVSFVAATAWFEVIGFAIRILMIEGSSPGFGQYVGMQCFLIITPVLLPIADYVMVGRLLTQGETSVVKIKPHWVARLFTGSDIFSLLVQSGGAGLISSSNLSSQKMGRNILLFGLGVQLLFFTFFTSLTVYVHCSKRFALRNRDYWRNVFVCLYITIALMYIRNVYRIAEFVQGYDGYLASHEWSFYVFDFAMIFMCVCVFGVFHFGFYPPPEGDNDVKPIGAEAADDQPTADKGCCGLVHVKPSQTESRQVSLTPAAYVPGSTNNV